MAPLIVTGATGGSTTGAPAPNRLEIHDFVRDERMFSLYIQALEAIYRLRQEDLISFFQIGGIHGLPYTPWNDVGPTQGNRWLGYCTHGSVLFPTWHRPYVALFEQILQQYAKQIAATYIRDTAAWRRAAEDLRQPFWDWARNMLPPPEVISLDRVTITGADGFRREVDNPLRRYRFHPVDPSFPPTWTRWQATLRHPTNQTPTATDNVQALINTLRANQSSVTSTTYFMLTRLHTWPAFSNHTAGNGGGANSLESVHDGIHVMVGGGGHMSSTEVAGFDPIFFMHHCQVDRLLSLWSALNPGVWVNTSNSAGGSWTIPANSAVGPLTPLTPFWFNNSTFWTSRATEGVSPTQLGYTYPEFNGLDLGNPIAVRARIAQIVNQLYGGGVLSRFPPLSGLAVGGESESVVSATKDATPATAPAYTPPAGVASQGSNEDRTDDGAVPTTEALSPSAGLSPARLLEWAARIRVKQYELGSSFSVLLYLGPVPETPDDPWTSPNYVGAHHAFVNGVPEQCSNCTDQADLVIEGYVHLNDGIAKHSRLGSFEPNVVKPYLSGALNWVVRKADGTVVDLENVPSLEVTVLATPLTLAPGEPFPVAGETVYHHDITRGRRGGSRGATD
ncbi:photo-regulated tyrosinase [Trametes meyenii]|nr:photo-regulated tyrosinase [Trametes meyenii]